MSEHEHETKRFPLFVGDSYMFDRIREWIRNRHLVKLAYIVLDDKRKINGKTVKNLDIRNFFVNPDNSELQSIAYTLKARNPKTFALLKNWMKDNIAYQYEGNNDFWQLPFETLTRLKGDCDDFAILTANLLLALGFPYYDVYINVVEFSNGDMHTVCTYKDQMIDPLFPNYDKMPDNWHLWFRWNKRNAYTLRENLQ